MSAVTPESRSAARPIRLGVVSFLNTLPLIDGLDGLSDIDMRFAVPSHLIDGLHDDETELALCSSIDYQRSEEPLVVVPAGCLACDGPTLTVRLYSQTPIDEVTQVYCDTDSHTSVVLMRLLLRQRFGMDPELIDYDAREHVAANRPIDWPETMLLIGDKVVTDSPPAVRYPHQLDLGAAWREDTGLPFVFAAWMARADADESRLRAGAAILDHQRRHNHERLDGIIHRRAEPRGWPRDLARQYLTQCLKYDLDDRCRQGLERFFDDAAAHGLIERHRPLTLLEF